MSEVKPKVHLIADESLGGVLREYVEVNRHPEKGDYVYVSKMDGADVSKIAKVIDDDFDGDFSYDTIQLDRYIYGEDLMVCSSPEDKFATLEPTDIVHIDGDRYRLVDRKAKVGEKVIVVNADDITFEGYKNGDIFIVREVRHSVIFVTVDSGEYVALSHFEYNVLDPVEPAETDDDVLTVDETEAPKSVLDLLANLARRVTELERKFENLESRQKRLMGRIADTEEKIEMALGDIVMLDERTQPLVALVKAVKADE